MDEVWQLGERVCCLEGEWSIRAQVLVSWKAVKWGKQVLCLCDFVGGEAGDKDSHFAVLVGMLQHACGIF